MKAWGTNAELWNRWENEAADADGEHRPVALGDMPCESPIERQLAGHLVSTAGQWGFEVIPQFKLGRYRYDFAIAWDGNVIALVECDGAEFHSTPDQLKRDAAKDLLAEQSGFRMFRYSGREIHRDPWKCAEEIIFRLCRHGP